MRWDENASHSMPFNDIRSQAEQGPSEELHSIADFPKVLHLILSFLDNSEKQIEIGICHFNY